MQPRIALLNIGHPDYPNDIGEEIAAQACEALGQAGVEVVTDGRACTDPLDAVERGRALAGQRLDGVILWLGTWIECSTAVAALREFEHLPFALWGFNMVEREGRRESTGSFVSAAVLKGSLDRMGYNFRTLLGLPQDPVAVASALTFCRAAAAFQALKRTRIGLVGYASMSMYPGTFDHALLRRYIGPEVIHLDTYTLVRQAEAATDAEVAAIAGEITGCASIGVTPERLAKSSRLVAGLRALVKQHSLHGLNLKCQYELSQEFGMTACVPLSLLADQGLVTACEGDVPLSVTMAMLDHLTPGVVTYGDILDLEGDEMLLSSCGLAPMSLAHPTDGPEVLELGYPGFDGIICSCTLKRGPVTIARLVEGRGDYHLIIATGEGLDTDRRQGRFPALRIRLDGDPQRLLSTLASQHFALAYGDQTAALQELARILNIEVIHI